METIRSGSGLFAALIVIIAGYIALAAGDTVVAPLLLVLGYCILVPVFLLRSFLKASGE